MTLLWTFKEERGTYFYTDLCKWWANLSIQLLSNPFKKALFKKVIIVFPSKRFQDRGKRREVIKHSLYSIQTECQWLGISKIWSLIWCAISFWCSWLMDLCVTSPSACQQSWRSCPHLEKMYFCSLKQKPAKKYRTFAQFSKGNYEEKSYTRDIKTTNYCVLPWFHWTLHWQCSYRHLQLHLHSTLGQWLGLWQWEIY